MNTFGRYIRLTTFGESHGTAIGGIVDGLPPRMPIDKGIIASMMAQRRPGTGSNVSQRSEPDTVEILSGVSADGVTLGTPVAFIIRNSDCRSDDYGQLRHAFRPNHGDYTWWRKYGIREHRGGGRASARETAARVAAAAIAMPLLKAKDITVTATLGSVGASTDAADFDRIISAAREAGDSVGGTVECRIAGVPAGLGEPVFGKLQSALAGAMLSIPGVKGFEYGLGFNSARCRGSECLDIFMPGDPQLLHTATNFSGGIQGGISTGGEIVFNTAFKPTPTISRPVETVDDSGNRTVLDMKGRHDPCIAVRGVAVVKAMAILVIADALVAAGHTFSFDRLT